MLNGLKSELPGFYYSYIDVYNAMERVFQEPATYGTIRYGPNNHSFNNSVIYVVCFGLNAGFIDVKTPCCGLGKVNTGTQCLLGSPYCSDREHMFFWDEFHPTEAASRTFVELTCNEGSSLAFPISVPELIAI